MKKKTLFFVTAFVMLCCLLTIGICAAEPVGSDEFGEITLITDNDKINSKKDFGYADGDTARVVVKVPDTETYLTYPMYYFFGAKDDGQNGYQPLFDASAINEATGLTYNEACIIRLEIPNDFTALSTNYTKTNAMTNLKYVKLHKNITILHASAFANLKLLTTVEWADNTSADVSATIGKSVFENCTALTNIQLPAHLTSMGERALAGCTSLTSVTIPSRVTAIATANFMGSSALANVTFANVDAITAINHKGFDGCAALSGNFAFNNVTTIGTYAFYNAGKNEGTNLVLSFPNLVTLGGGSGDTHVFSYSGVKELYFGNKITTMSHNTFSNCTRLEIVEFTGVTEDFKFKSYTFEGCTALKAFSIPDGLTELPSRMFRNCTSLGAVYIPSSVTAINSGDNDHATFKGCTNMYFVSTPFTHENIPEEPTVYYFPSKLTTITGEAFDHARINDVVVLPTGVTSLTQGYTFEGTTSKSGKPTVVFMGDMEAVTVNSWGASKILFANENDIDAASAGYKGSVSAIYCNAQGNTEHLIEKTLSTEADCVNPQMTANYCFCGSIVGEAETVGEALGHDLTGNSYYVFESLTVAGKTCVDCGRCDHIEEIAHENAIVVAMGYSVKTYGTDKTFATGYFVDKEMLKNYENAKGVSVSFGFGFNAANTFNYDGTLNSFAIVAPIVNVGTSEKDFSAFTYRMIYATDDHIDDLIVIAAYVIEADENGESLSFLNAVDGELETASYNSIFEKVNNQ